MQVGAISTSLLEGISGWRLRARPIDFEALAFVGEEKALHAQNVTFISTAGGGEFVISASGQSEGREGVGNGAFLTETPDKR